MSLRPNSTTFTISLALICALWVTSIFLPGMTSGNLFAATVIILVCSVVLKFTPVYSKTATYILLCGGFMMCLGVAVNTWYFTTACGGTPENPVLQNSDMSRWWNDIMYHLGDEDGVKANHVHGYFGAAMAFVLQAFGQTIGSALLLNVVIGLVSVIVAALITFRITGSKKTAALAMAATMAVCYWLAVCTLLLKDPTVFLGIAIAGLSFTYDKVKFICLFSIAALILALSRNNFIPVIVIGLAIVAVNKKNWLQCLGAAALGIIIWSIFQNTQDIINSYDAVAANDPTYLKYNAENQMAYYNIVGDYDRLSPLMRVLYLPFSAAVQLFIPFPWNFTRDMIFGTTEFWAHISYPWYIFSMVLLYYIATNIRLYRSFLFRLTLWGVMGWLVPCYMFGGTVSRYGLAFVIIFAPAVAQTIIKNRKSKKFYISLSVLSLVYAVVLIVAYNLQSHASIQAT